MGLEAPSPPRQHLGTPKHGAGEAPCSVLMLAVAVAAALSCLLILRPGAAAGGVAPLVLPHLHRRLGGGDGASELAAARALLASWPEGKPKACILVLARNSDLEGVLSSVAELERRFNRQFQYPYCYLNNDPFSAEFRAATSAASAAPSFYGRVPPQHWSYPPHIDRGRAAAAREAAAGRMPYGGSESYRHMCRWFSGFFFDHPLLAGFECYWRVEPHVHFMCDIRTDPFRAMRDANQSLAWTIVMEEVPPTIPTLWPEVQRWLAANPQHVAPDNLLPAFTEEDESEEAEEGSRPEGGREEEAPDTSNAGSSGSGSGSVGEQKQALCGQQQRRVRYTGCHFWSNFEVGRLAFFRSPAYRQLFAHLDQAGGFFYERWGDAPVHTLAAAALLDRRQIRFASDVGYAHGSWSHCPSAPEDRERCSCNPLWDYHVLAQPRCQLDYTRRLAVLERLAEERKKK